MKTFSIVLFFMISLALPHSVSGETGFSLKAAFVRDGNLWVKIADAERQVTKKKESSSSRWSYDGNWLSYLEGKNQTQSIWVYNVKSGKKKLIANGNVSNVQWSPNENVLAYQIGETLYMKDIRKNKAEKQISSEIGNYSWLPNGNGFLASTISDPTPNGWNDIKFYKFILKNSQVKKIDFFNLPAQTIGSEEFGIGTSIFKWSPDQKWISFTKYPTASLSADADLLYVLSSDAKKLIKVDEMLNDPSWFQWAPSRNALAYIGGTGRMAIMNKFLNVKELPASKQGALTPEGFVDRDFTWNNNHVITVARSKESEWSNDPSERPLPALYQIDMSTKRQTQITRPKKGSGDFAPEHITKSNRLVWIRTNRVKSDVWVAATNGRKTRIWIKNIDQGDDYYEKWDWSNVFSVYDPVTKKRTE